MSHIIDLTGWRFGRLVVERKAPATGGEARWVCRCDCGGDTTTKGTLLRDGRTQSCGCLHREGVAERSTTHGHSPRSGFSPTYLTWASMKDRCRNPNSTEWLRYGGRGIEVCERWLAFPNFLADMGERPKGTTIDRIDNDGNYEPGNCRWSSDSRQARNRRSNRLISSGGVTRTVTEWAEALGIPRWMIYERLRRGASEAEAVSS